MTINLKDLQKNRTLTMPEAKKIDKVVEETGTSEIPYPVVDNDTNIAVIGNANIIKRDPQYYKVLVFVDKATTSFTKEELESINTADTLDESGTEYRVLLEVPLTEITVAKRESASMGVMLIQGLYYEDVEQEDGTVISKYITSSIKRQARLLEIIQDKYISKMLKQTVVDLLELPEGLQTITVSQAVEVFVDFATQNADLLNENDSNLD